MRRNERGRGTGIETVAEIATAIETANETESGSATGTETESATVRLSERRGRKSGNENVEGGPLSPLFPNLKPQTSLCYPSHSLNSALCLALFFLIPGLLYFLILVLLFCLSLGRLSCLFRLFSCSPTTSPSSK